MRKPAVVVLIALGSAIAAPGQAQFALGGRVGLNVASLGGDVTTDSELGLVAGVLFGIQIAGNWWVQPEVSYTRKGASTTDQVLLDPEGLVTVHNTTRLDYVELQLPVSVELPVESDKFRPRLYGGPSLARSLACEVETELSTVGGSLPGETTDCKADVTRLDYGLVLGVGLDLGGGPGKFTADLRYDLGLADISEEAASEKNRVLQVLVGYKRSLR